MNSVTLKPGTYLWLAATGLAAGIVLAAELPDIPRISPIWITVLAAVGVGLWPGGQLRKPWVAALFIVGSATGLGWVRQRQANELAPHHVARIATEQRQLIRVRGEVVSALTRRPPIRHNPFLARAPEEHTGFVLAASALVNRRSAVPLCGLIRINVRGSLENLRPGDVIEVTGFLYRPRGPQNPGEPDWARWNALQGIRAGISVESPDLIQRQAADGSWPRVMLARARTYLTSLLLENGSTDEDDPRAQLLDAVILGQRSAIDPRLDEAFMRTGAIHVLSVSGFHLAALAGACWYILRRVLGVGRKPTTLVALLISFAYAALTDGSAPMLRAIVMASVAALAVFMDRPLLGLGWLALAAIIVLVFNPMELFRPGFQLSFLQVGLLISLTPPVYRWVLRRVGHWPPPDAHTRFEFVKTRLLRATIGLIVISFVAWIGSAPLVWFHFGAFMPFAAIQSALLTIPFSLLVVLGMVALATKALVPALGGVLMDVLYLLSGALIRLVEAFAAIPGTSIPLPPASIAATLSAFAALAALIWLCRRAMWPPDQTDDPLTQPPSPLNSPPRTPRLIRDRLLPAVVLLGACLVMGWNPRLDSAAVWDPGDCVIHSLAVGNGSAHLALLPDGSAFLFDIGTDANRDAGALLLDVLRRFRIDRLSAVAVSHGNTDHYSGLPTLKSQIPIAELWISDTRERMTTRLPFTQHLWESLPDRPLPQRLGTGDTRGLGGADFEILWPPHSGFDATAENDHSLVCRIRSNRHSILLTGDISNAALEGLLRLAQQGEIELASDILIAPHHGAVIPARTAAFLLAVRPGVIVVSSRYERPAFEELVRMTLGPRIPVHTTGQTGDVVVRIPAAGAPEVRLPFSATIASNPAGQTIKPEPSP